MDNKLDLLEVLEYIDPSTLSYLEWTQVGMALKEEGYSAEDWDRWSVSDVRRYHLGECEKKWNSFNGNIQPITGATIIQMAKENGWHYEFESKELDWNDEIGKDYKIINTNWVERKEFKEPQNWNPVKELITYLEILFDSTENVGYVTETWEKDGKYLPSKGAYDRTAGQLIEQLSKCNGDIGAVIGDYKEEAGAWIRFNPLDGKGVKNDNVTDFRYTLVESDSQDLAKQNAIIRELELPVACLVYSGKKSIHAIIRVDAKDYKEYRERVDYIYSVCKKNGLEIDSQNRNPSRLSRMPGIMRNGKKQFLIDTNIGKTNYEEWYKYIEDINDDLPELETLDFDNMPDLAPVLIDNVLRQGHKMLIAGPSKAGKSFALIELCIAIAEGKKWFNWNCAQGRVLYVNLELDRPSCLHRFKEVYTALNISHKNIQNIDIWNLRGKTLPMDALAPKIIRRAIKKKYIAIIIDPIYKVLTGDENSAHQMSVFTNQFDKVASELGASIIYCHHHSKGGQGNKKSMDRASGSGVFARDPDALIDLIELEIDEKIKQQQHNRIYSETYASYIEKYNKPYYDEEVGLDDTLSKPQMTDHATRALNKKQIEECQSEIDIKISRFNMQTAWQIDGILREFPKFKTTNMWFKYPIHEVDTVGILADIKLENSPIPDWKKAQKKKKDNQELTEKEKIEELERAIEVVNMGEPATKKEVADYLNISVKTLNRRIKDLKNYSFDKNSMTFISTKTSINK